MGAALRGSERASTRRDGISRGRLEDFRIFDRRHSRSDVGPSQSDSSIHLLVSYPVVPWATRRAGPGAASIAAARPVVLHAIHDGATGYAGHAVHGASAAAVSRRPASRRGARIHSSGSRQRNRRATSADSRRRSALRSPTRKVRRLLSGALCRACRLVLRPMALHRAALRRCWIHAL